MNDVAQLYFNDLGITFYWKKNHEIIKDKVQIVFKETGFYFTPDEVRSFSEIISYTFNNLSCQGCPNSGSCHKYLLKTPVKQIDLAVSKAELYLVKDLIEGTLFNMKLNDYLDSICSN